jgi:hypothetical protein
MQRELEKRVLFQNLNKREISFLASLVKDKIEVANRLMIVNAKGEFNFSQG